MEILAHAANLCDLVTEAERSFIRVRLPKVAAKTQLVVARDRFFDKDQRPFTLNHTYQHPSGTEIHRIRRALWRVCLYLEAFYTPDITQPNNELERVIIEELGAVENETQAYGNISNMVCNLRGKLYRPSATLFPTDDNLGARRDGLRVELSKP